MECLLRVQLVLVTRRRRKGGGTGVGGGLVIFVLFLLFRLISHSFHPVAECTHEFVYGRIGHSLLDFLRHSDPRATPTNGEAPELNSVEEEEEEEEEEVE